jgi:hypothetical protein
MGLKPRRESGVLAEVLDWLRAHGALAIRINSGGRPWTDRKGRKRVFRMNDQVGCSDVVCCLRGRFVSIETKLEGGRTDPTRLAKQQAFAAAVERAGGIALTVESVRELEQDLKEAGLL